MTSFDVYVVSAEGLVQVTLEVVMVAWAVVKAQNSAKKWIE